MQAEPIFIHQTPNLAINTTLKKIMPTVMNYVTGKFFLRYAAAQC